MSATALRFVVYALLGWGAEIAWTAAGSALTRDAAGAGPARARWRLQGHTYLWMFPIYGSLVFLFEPLHDLVRGWAWPARATLYAAGFLAVEYVTGWLLRRATGACPWDYAARERPSRWQVHGLMRLDYAPAWALAGLALERVHDFLLRLTLAIGGAP